MEREVWFEKILWSYMPCHWKGVAVIVAFAIPTIFAILFGQWAFDALGYRDADWLAFPLFFFPAYISLMGTAKRHS